MNPPSFLFLHVASECNLACRHCHFWMSDTKSKPDRISTEAMEGIIEEFSAMNPLGKVILCGGEPMLEYHRFIKTCQEARSHGLRVFSATNGYGVYSDERAEHLLTHGPHEFLISLDSHNPAIHDEIRGRTGSFQAAVIAVQRLVTARAKLGNRESRIHVMTLLSKATYGHLHELYQLVLTELKVDKLKINALQPSFGVHSGKTPSDDFFAEHSQLNPEELRRELESCNRDFNLKLNPDWIGQLCQYYRDLQGKPNLHLGWDAGLTTQNQICNCQERNIVIGLYGEIGHCYSFHNFPPTKYQQEGDLKRFWAKSPHRESMKSCRRLCAIGHSNRNLSASLNQA